MGPKVSLEVIGNVTTTVFPYVSFWNEVNKKRMMLVCSWDFWLHPFPPYAFLSKCSIYTETSELSSSQHILNSSDSNPSVTVSSVAAVHLVRMFFRRIWRAMCWRQRLLRGIQLRIAVLCGTKVHLCRRLLLGRAQPLPKNGQRWVKMPATADTVLVADFSYCSSYKLMKL
jgi:hypothetical protein